MDKLDLVQPVDFLKVSHHGSDTGMPPDEILDKLLPMPRPAKRRRGAVSTYPNTYPGVPDPKMLKDLGKRIDVRSTRDLAPGKLFLQYRFSSTGP